MANFNSVDLLGNFGVIEINSVDGIHTDEVNYRHSKWLAGDGQH